MGSISYNIVQVAIGVESIKEVLYPLKGYFKKCTKSFFFPEMFPVFPFIWIHPVYEMAGTKDKIKFKKIFIPMLGDDSASTPEVQLNLAELIAKEIKSKNATFEDMAKRYSKDLYAEKGGDWPVTERSTLSPESAAIIFGAQPGEIIGPLVDSTGFTIVLVEKKELAPPPPLSAIKEQIDMMARNKRSNERYKKWVERLRKKAIVKVYI